MSKHLKAFIALGLAVMLTLGVAGAVSAGGPAFGGRGMGANGTEAIAEELGMTVDELSAELQAGKTIADLAEEQGVALADLRDAATEAREAARREAIEQAVTDGDLTREQADWMLQGIALGDTGFGPRGGRGFGDRGFGGLGLDAPSGDNAGLEAAAEVLDMTADELSLQLWGGRTLADLAESAGVELEDVQAAIETARQEQQREAIAQAVEEGRLTQEQADWMLQGIEQGYTRTQGIMGGGPRGGRGHGGFGMDGMPAAPDIDRSTGAGAPRMRAGQSL